jgi:hypothetical protein
VGGTDVGVLVGVLVAVGVLVEVPVGVLVAVLVGVLVGVDVGVLVGVGVAPTAMLAIAALPEPPSVDVTALVTLSLTPTVVPMIEPIVTKHEAFGARVTPARLMLDEPHAAVTIPLQVPERPQGFVITRPAGRVSDIPTPVSVTAGFGFVRVKVKVAAPLSGIEGTPNAFSIVGGATCA